jgi:hypothetical protein
VCVPEHTYDEAEIAQVIDCLFKPTSVAYLIFLRRTRSEMAQACELPVVTSLVRLS